MANSTGSIHALFSLAERSSMLLSAQNEAEGPSDSMEWALKSSSLRGGFFEGQFRGWAAFDSGDRRLGNKICSSEGSRTHTVCRRPLDKNCRLRNSRPREVVASIRRGQYPD